MGIAGQLWVLPLRDDQVQQVKQATDIGRLIGEFIALKPKGREFVCLCPFHADKNPSMYVVPHKQMYHCFVCQASGDAFGFMMQYHKMSFREALEDLARRAGIVLRREAPSHAHAPEEGPSETQRLLTAHEQALRYFRDSLKHPELGAAARAYLTQRGISEAMCEAFQIGYAPDRWDGLLLAAREHRWELAPLQTAGLLIPRKSGDGLYDRFRHRLIFPIFNQRGRTIAFGGRKLRAEDEPKYLNSPESPLFQKSATLYGLERAGRPIISSGTAILVEGYTDVIACHQAGEANVVATLGTAFTHEHARLLKGKAERIVLLFDADEAGMKAADRALESVLSDEVDVAVAVLPDAKDPADLFLEADGKDRWQRALAGARDALSYQLDRMRAALQTKETVTGRQHLAEKYLQSLAHAGLTRVTNPARRGFLMQRLCELLHLPLAEVTLLLRQATPPPAATSYATGGPQPTSQGAAPATQHPSASPAGRAADLTPWDVPPDGLDAPFDSDAPGEADNREDVLAALRPAARTAALDAQRHLLGCLLLHPAWLYREMPDGQPLDEALSPAEFIAASARQLFLCIVDRLARQGLSSDSLITDLTREGRQDLVTCANESILSVTRQVGDDVVRRQRLLIEAAQALLAARREIEFRQSQAATYDSHARLQAAIEHRRRHPSPLRIPVLRTSAPTASPTASPHASPSPSPSTSPSASQAAPVVRHVPQSLSAPRPESSVQ